MIVQCRICRVTGRSEDFATPYVNPKCPTCCCKYSRQGRQSQMAALQSLGLDLDSALAQGIITEIEYGELIK